MKRKDGLIPHCEQESFDPEAMTLGSGSPDGCYIANPSDMHPLFELHELLNTSFVGDTGTADLIVAKWEEDAGERLTLENLLDISLLHGELTAQRGPQRVINAIQVERKNTEEPMPGAEPAIEPEFED